MVITGIEKLIQKDLLRGRRPALLVNHTSVTGDLRYSWDVLLDKGINVVRVFSPEHGLFGTEQDQDPVFSNGKQSPVEVVSLYEDSFESLVPRESMVRDIDCLVYDIQDVGARYYTFVNSMVMAMKALNGSGIELIVCDRPNPLGGEAVEGPLLEEGYRSFVGVLPVPVRHGMTAGEIALMARDLHELDLSITVIPMEGWERSMYFGETGLPWVPPSPNMPTPSTALVYPGSCLVEGLNLSEGRGTTTPFETAGAPWVRDPYLLAENLNGLLEGVCFRPVWFKPTFNKFAGDTCGGVYIHITDRNRFRPFLAGVALTKYVHDLHPELEFLHGVYEFNSEHPAFDLLAGSSRIREMIQNGQTLEETGESWRREEKEFLKTRKDYTLY